MPFAALTSDFQINLESIWNVRNSFVPFGAVGIAPRYNFDGYVLGRGGEENNGYTQIFRNGVIEATKSPIVRLREGNHLVIPGIGVEQHIFEKLHIYFDGLQAIGVPPPFLVSFVFEGVKGAVYAVRPNGYDDPPPPIDRDILYLPECFIENFGTRTEYHKAAT